MIPADRLAAIESREFSFGLTLAENRELCRAYRGSGDPIVDSVRAKLAERSIVGQAKYGHNMTRTDLSRVDWLRHAQEEMLDAALYLERLITDELNPPTKETP